MWIRDFVNLNNWYRVLTIGGLFAVVAVLVCSGSGKGAENEVEMGQRTQVTRIDPYDLNAIREWALGICQGRSIAEVAAALGTPARMEDVIAVLTKGLSEESTKVVKETCEQELKHATGGGDAGRV